MYNMLIVDDESFERDGIKYLVKKHNLDINVNEAENGVEALEYLKRNATDILMTDIRMPLMDGISLVEAVREYDDAIKIVISSAYDEFEYAKKAIDHGVDHYFLKPIDTGEFLKVIHKIIHMHRKEREPDYQFYGELDPERSADDGGRLDEPSPSLLNRRLDEIKESIRGGKIEQSKQQIGVFFESIQQSRHFSSLYVKHLSVEIIRVVCAKFKPHEYKFESVMNAVYYLRTSAEIRETICELLDDEDACPAGDKEDGRNVIKKVVDLIHNQYAEDINLESIAASVYLSPSYLSHLFKKETGESIIKFISNYRLSKAGHYLRNTNMKIIDISAEVGFQNVTYFCTLFKGHYGLSPAKYREQAE